MRLSLRTLFWLILAAAIVVAWGREHVRLAARLERMKGHSGNRLLPGLAVLRARKLQRLRSLDDQDLLDKFRVEGEQKKAEDDSLYQGYLSELLQRGMRKELREHFDMLRGEADARPREGSSGLSVPLEGTVLLPLLAAVRRAEGQPDPIRIHLAFQPGATPEEPPLIVPTLENVDVERQEFYLHTTGSRGTRRNGCWQIQLTDERGRRVSLATDVVATGGFAGFRTVAFGQRDECDQELDVRSYVKEPPPGKYKLQVFFNTDDIAGDAGLASLIVFASEPLDVLVSSSGSSEGRTAIPLLVLLYAALLGTSVAIVIRRWRKSPQTTMKALVTWRDALAWTVLIALAIAWHSDARRLGDQIHRLPFDEDADWTWKLAD
jgi:hypothetical protein